jgi:hypothetical protein
VVRFSVDFSVWANRSGGHHEDFRHQARHERVRTDRLLGEEPVKFDIEVISVMRRAMIDQT